ncbi:MAG: ribonuclease H-like domain-containing protein, partial [Firmicutes bacterium]|nr:ribonuclease H-like domain-containing protein [Bacillota bacterium]
PAAAAAGAPSPPPLQPLLALARPRGLDRWPQPALWFDLETTGLGGGAGVRAFLVGVARLEGQELAVRQHVLPDLDREAAFLEEVARDLAAPSWVTYNGRTFDAPLLRDRCTLHGVEPPAPLLELDLLPAARAVWRRRLGSAALSRLATEVLGLPPEDGPGGGEMPALYAAFLAEGDPFWLAGAVQHNRVDLLALASLTWELAAALEDPPPSWPAPDLIGLARLAERCGRLPAALLALERAARRAERPGERAAALAALARLHKRGRRYGAAAALLEEAVAAPVLPSLTHLDELAKLQEHRLGDLHRALALTERALRLLTLQGEGRAALARAAWERRRARLLRRLARAAAGSGRGRRPG